GQHVGQSQCCSTSPSYCASICARRWLAAKGRHRMKYSTSDLLDTARWIAAFAVVLSHARNFLLLDWTDVTHRSAVYGAFYFASGFGHIAVIVFFVLSGYLVGGKAFEALREARFSVRRYLVDRLSRLYPPLLLALVLTAACDFVGLAFFNAQGFYE